MKFIRKTKRTNNKNKKKKGFTLIELMAVIAIVAILAAAFLPKITGYFDEAKKVGMINQAKNVVTTYELVRNKFSASKNETNTTVSDVATLAGIDLLSNDSIDKLYDQLTIEDCRNALNAEKYSLLLNTNKSKLADVYLSTEVAPSIPAGAEDKTD